MKLLAWVVITVVVAGNLAVIAEVWVKHGIIGVGLLFALGGSGLLAVFWALNRVIDEDEK